MFGRIVPRYDLMNRLMTGGQDARWRRRAAAHARKAGEGSALDIATGTGDLAFALADAGFARVVGVDFSPEMIAAAEAKRNGRAGVTFQVADALDLPFADGEFDACTVAFGLRNMASYDAALREMARVLKPGGRLICLELTKYRNIVMSPIFRFYFHRIMPAIGGVLSGDRDAYRYLPHSVDHFPDAVALGEMMRRAGFERIEIERLAAGTVALHIAVKPS
jgi:demethylmenaquinone methyltransferase/2-methoxy-6-polyprenyl-1,4-benzoquinol methylase